MTWVKLNASVVENITGREDYKIDTTIEIRIEYSLNGSWVWTRTLSKDTLHYCQTNFDSIKDRKKSLNKFVEKHRWGQ